jgi:hypothetical protein
MDRGCEYLEGCLILKYLRGFEKETYVEMYCEGTYVKCRRRKLHVAGKPVPENLLPYGGKLWEEDDIPPRIWAR